MQINVMNARGQHVPKPLNECSEIHMKRVMTNADEDMSIVKQCVKLKNTSNYREHMYMRDAILGSIVLGAHMRF